MNSIEELVREYCVTPSNARQMIKACKKHIGEDHGDYIITDVTYVGDQTKDVEETCKYCGSVIHRKLKNRSNKWYELQKICECQREKARLEREEQKREEKKAEKYSVLQKHIGVEYGEFVVESADVEKVTLRCMECGAEKTLSSNYYLSGKWSDCVCHAHRRNVERFTDDYIGRKNNMLTVIGITHDPKSGKKQFVCQCDCGKTTLVKPTIWEKGYIKSCGCYLENRAKDADPIKRIKGIHRGMMTRCYNPNDKSYEGYGKRGITICPEWHNVDNFIEWSLEHEYSNTKTIDRIDYNGNYEPSNCRWATWDVQIKNKRPRSKKRA